MATPSAFYLRKRSHGVYYIGIRVNGRTRWRSTGVSTQVEALSVLADYKATFKDERRFLTLRQFIDEFLTYSTANHAPRTVESFRHIQPLFL